MRRFSRTCASGALLLVIGLLAVSLGESQNSPSNSADLKDIKENFLRYDGKVVTLVGFLRGSHVGTFIESGDHAAVIRVRLAEDLKEKRVRPVRDARYRQFEEAANSLYAPAIRPQPRASVAVRGLVSVLRRGGKVATSFNPYSEAPVEFVPIQILRFDALKPVVDPKQ
jgi:hypothetical protein